MKRNIALLFILVLSNSFVLYACPPIFYQYYKKDGKIYYDPQFSQTSEYEVELIGVDTTSFNTKKIKLPYYASDKYKVYYWGKPLHDVDVETVVFLGGEPILTGIDGYIKDKNGLYIDGNLGETNCSGEKITRYFFDKNNIYCEFSTSIYRAITPNEYIILRQHIASQNKLNQICEKSLQREYNF